MHRYISYRSFLVTDLGRQFPIIGYTCLASPSACLQPILRQRNAPIQPWVVAYKLHVIIPEFGDQLFSNCNGGQSFQCWGCSELRLCSSVCSWLCHLSTARMTGELPQPGEALQSPLHHLHCCYLSFAFYPAREQLFGGPSRRRGRQKPAQLAWFRVFGYHPRSAAVRMQRGSQLSFISQVLGRQLQGGPSECGLLLSNGAPRAHTPIYCKLKLSEPHRVFKCATMCTCSSQAALCRGVPLRGRM